LATKESAKRKNILIAVVLVALIAIGTGIYVIQQKPSPTTTTTSAAGIPVPNKDTLVEESSRVPFVKGVDPALTWDASTNLIMENIYETLVAYDGRQTDKFIPWLAESWDISPNGQMITLHLRRGITFHDGTPFNATAVKFSIDRAILINTDSGPQFLLADAANMAIKGGPRYFNAKTVKNYNASEAKIYLAQEGVKILDPYTVQITLEHPFAPTLAMLAFNTMGILSPSYVIAHCSGSAEMAGVMPGIECQYMFSHAAGTGPYILTTYDPKNQIVLERFDNYWGGPTHSGPGKLKRYIMKYVVEVGTRELDLQSGTADAIELSAANAFDLVDKNSWVNSQTIKPLKSGIRVWTSPTLQLVDLALNPRVPPLDKVEFRQGLAYSIDYDRVISQVLNGFGTKRVGEIPKGMVFYDPSLPRYEYNPTKARELFQKSGTIGAKLEIYYATGNTALQSVALILKDGLKASGDIDLSVKELDPSTIQVYTSQLKLPMRLYGFLPDFADPADFLSAFVSPGAATARLTDFYHNQTIISLAQQAGSSLDPTARAAMYREIQLEMYRKVPRIPLYTPIALIAERDWVLPSDSPIGRALYNPIYKDGDGGVSGGYHAYGVWKADTTMQIAVDINSANLANQAWGYAFMTADVKSINPRFHLF
jgi:peptide/nickel transport system substrate-binding protein